MELKNIFKMTKTDRYTQDGRDELAKLQETEDVKYKTGDISQKTGLQKQPDGSWAPPKKGARSGAGKPEAAEGWTETRMASGKLYDLKSQGKRIIEQYDPETETKTFKLRDLNNSRAPDKEFKTLEEAKAAAGSWAPPKSNGVIAQQKQKMEAEKYEAARRDAQAPSKKTEVNTPGLRKDVQEAIKRSSPEEIKAYIKELRTPGSRMSRYFDNPDLLANVYEDELNKITESKPDATTGSGVPIKGSDWISLPSGTRMTIAGAREKYAKNRERIESLKKLMEGNTKAGNFRIGAELKRLENENEYLDEMLPPENKPAEKPETEPKHTLEVGSEVKFKKSGQPITIKKIENYGGTPIVVGEYDYNGKRETNRFRLDELDYEQKEERKDLVSGNTLEEGRTVNFKKTGQPIKIKKVEYYGSTPIIVGEYEHNGKTETNRFRMDEIETPDSAPRELTGDCKIRIRK